MATAIVKPDTLDAADTLFDDLTDLRAMLICVTGEGMQGFAALSDEVQESYLFAMQRRVDSALIGLRALTASMRRPA
ncbi:hypothetical protein [Thermomonas sp. XSG]|uniref:hypothetical protein n=1 Tax=Thermomonas sp. XSG TaxID=2771436 RepID=UPI00168019A9|nr:hypothetical protein [Thermomonas sp. XSG]QNU14213.1 hypothetical protein ICG51_000419 [Thermomonas sp. XSG]